MVYIYMYMAYVYIYIHGVYIYTVYIYISMYMVYIYIHMVYTLNFVIQDVPVVVFPRVANVTYIEDSNITGVVYLLES